MRNRKWELHVHYQGWSGLVSGFKEQSFLLEVPRDECYNILSRKKYLLHLFLTVNILVLSLILFFFISSSFGHNQHSSFPATALPGCLILVHPFIRKPLRLFSGCFRDLGLRLRNVLIVCSSNVWSIFTGSYYHSLHIFPVPNPLWRKKGDCHRLRQQVREAASYHFL